jgi:uncharacterized membrane protein YbjE (DUF340 family)
VIKYVLTALTGGLILGLFLPSNAYSTYGTIFLYLLIFVIGISVGANTDTLKRAIRVLKRDVLLLPIFSIGGALIGGVIAGMLTGVPLKMSLAIAAGLGWYSLAGPMLSVASPIWGALAFLSNIEREIISFVLIPWMKGKKGPLVPIAMGGATAMDTTMPMITRFSGEEYVLGALYNGMVLSMAVPLLIGFILSL